LPDSDWQTLVLSGVHPWCRALPLNKLAMLKKLDEQDRKVLVLGDGVNDVPVLAAADISIAMGSRADLAKT
jgi:Cu2+-exporting ATPase